MPKGNPKIWTEIENNQLIESRKQNIPTRRIAKTLKLHYTTVKNQLLKLNIFKSAKDIWTPENIKIMIALYNNGSSISYISRKIGICEETIFKKLKQLNIHIRNTHFWTKEQKEILTKEMEKQTSFADIAKILGFSIKQVIAKKQKLKLKYNPNHHWTEQDLKLLQELNTKGSSIEEISKILNRTIGTTKNKMQSLNMKLLNGCGPLRQSSRTGYGGKYKNWYFRSLNELTFMIFLEEHQIEWKSAESNRYRIPYSFKGQDRYYHPDFIIENKYIIEIKPKKMWSGDMVLSKYRAALEICKINNLIYKVIDFETNLNKVKEEYKKGYIIFDKRRRETQFYLKFIGFLNS